MPKYMPRPMTRSGGGSSSSGGSREDDEAQPWKKEGSVSLQYPLLTKSNYAAWSIKMEVYMQAQGVWNAVESEDLVETRKDKMALAAIFQGITEETLLQLGSKKSAKEAWHALRTMHLGADRVKEVRAQALRWELESLRMKDSDSVDDYTGKVSTVVSQLRGLGEEVDESYVVKKMLRSVSSKFIQIASTIEEFGDLSIKSIEDVIGSLKAHEERMKGHEERVGDRVLLTRTEWKNSGESSKHNSTSRNINFSNGAAGVEAVGLEGDVDEAVTVEDEEPMSISNDSHSTSKRLDVSIVMSMGTLLVTVNQKKRRRGLMLSNRLRMVQYYS